MAAAEMAAAAARGDEAIRGELTLMLRKPGPRSGFSTSASTGAASGAAASPLASAGASSEAASFGSALAALLPRDLAAALPPFLVAPCGGASSKTSVSRRSRILSTVFLLPPSIESGSASGITTRLPKPAPLPGATLDGAKPWPIMYRAKTTAASSFDLYFPRWTVLLSRLARTSYETTPSFDW